MIHMQKYNNYSKYRCDIFQKVYFKGYLLKISPFLDKKQGYLIMIKTSLYKTMTIPEKR